MGIQENNDEPDIEVEVDDTPDDAETAPDAGPETDPEETPRPKPPAAKRDEPEWKPPTEAEWRRTQAALKKSNDDGKLHRLRSRELEEKVRAGETEHEKALREAREEGEKRFREPMKKSGVRAALAEAGFPQPERLMKLIDWDAITVDDDGDLIGAETEVDRVKADYPELLPQDKPKPKARPTGAPKPAAVDKPKSTAEQHAARLIR
ncbi:phage scaffolding protein [Streptomyces sp. NPDC001422]|uniref:phage scaffolding protein n=1 Tax=Streptomyces sp. NPDC001422 TaxID=3364575 RepID=UPI0036901291